MGETVDLFNIIKPVNNLILYIFVESDIKVIGEKCEVWMLNYASGNMVQSSVRIAKIEKISISLLVYLCNRLLTGTSPFLLHYIVHYPTSKNVLVQISSKILEYLENARIKLSQSLGLLQYLDHTMTKYSQHALI